MGLVAALVDEGLETLDAPLTPLLGEELLVAADSGHQFVMRSVKASIVVVLALLVNLLVGSFFLGALDQSRFDHCRRALKRGFYTINNQYNLVKIKLSIKISTNPRREGAVGGDGELFDDALADGRVRVVLLVIGEVR